MPLRLETPVLQVDAGKMSQIDTRNVESLFGMWTVFHKCAESIEEGKRLENMSWRLWNRETFCCATKPEFATKSSFDLSAPKPSAKDIPELSSSVSSDGSVEAERAIPRRSPQDESPLSNSRGRERHITPKRLEQLVVNIKEKTVPTPLSPAIAASVAALADTTPRPSSPSPTRPVPTEAQGPPSDRSTDSQSSSRTLDSESSAMPVHLTNSDTSVSSTANTQSPAIVHGFSPSVSTLSHRSRSILATQPHKASQSLAPPKPDHRKKETTFIIGNGSVSEEDSSYEERVLMKPQRSSLTEGLHKSAAASQQPKKQASFREILDSRPMDSEDAIESDDESVIDEEEEEEDDDSSWEDSDNESQSSSVEEKPMFQRVDSRPNLTSRRSLLTTALTQGERAQALQRAAIAAQSSPNLRRSRRSSPIGPSMPASPDDGSELTMRGPEVTRSKPIIVTTTNTHPIAHSPRTTRRNMLSTELTESLRKHLLWERQPRGGMANPAFKRSHTTQNMGNLREHPPRVGPSDTKNNNSWNHHFDFGPAEYHAKGW